ncbi:DEAD/DEAH box helicase family protein [candidate division KSB1 bacterium]|nr:DEAD/DEAH box helicase family protein [candidate division KSB1 bacterium]
MKVDLKPFQEIASRSVLDELAEARVSVAKGKLQAVVLSAPTGSGKTITVAAVIDQTFGGGDGIPARPETVFLWLSDSPELNVQSKAKLLAACDNLPFHRMITIDSESFDEERLYPEHVYFINTQLLGKDKRLTQGGDKRRYTFWQTVANTIFESPNDFVLIIDEAHRGASANDRNRTPIMQKFILGSEADGLPPVPLVLGMSATPQRFTALLGNTNRTQRPVIITTEDVRSSGLLKDMIIVHNPKTDAQTDLTLLEHAAGRWKHFTQIWKSYCDKEKEKETVRPILVVQVEDGTENILTRTNLSDVVRVIERQSGPLAVNEIVHSFQDQAEIQAGGRIIRKIEASRIQDDGEVKVVLFKTALTTGWDCPRAEVMMSFRRAQDPTSIAQLVGRMIRTPLARRIESDEMLNTVELFLPHYDTDALESVLSRLRSPDAEEGVPSRVESEAVEYPRNPEMTEVFEHLKTLPTYSVGRAPKMGDIKRALRLAGMLVHEGLNQDADEALREVLTKKLKEQRDAFVAKDTNWANMVRESGEVEVDVTLVAIAQMNVTGRKSIRMALSDESIDHLFDASGRMLAAGEGLHRTYWKRYHDHAKPNEAKLELFALMRKPDTLAELEKQARKQFDRFWKEHKAAIQKLPAADRARFHALIQASGIPAQQPWELPEQIVEKSGGEAWKHHLYCNAEGKFYATLNGWERSVLEPAMEEKGFVGWLRNLPRRDWAFCVPYELGGAKPFYPDFLIVRKTGKGYEVDIIEPHDDTRADTWAKAKGLAEFADKHGMDFGRLIIGRMRGPQIQTADMNDQATREKARKMQSQNDLESLFA